MDFINVAKGVDLLFVQSDRFKTERISVNFYLPLQKEKMAQRALLPHVLTSESALYPDFSALNRKLSSLYSADIFGSAEKLGDLQKINIDCCYLSETTLKSDISGSVISLLSELIFNPNLKNGEFCKQSVMREKRLTCERIIANYNNKRSYALSQALGFAFKGQAYGELSTGSIDSVKKITPKSLTDAYRDMLESAYVLIVAVAPRLRENLKSTFANAFLNISRNPAALPCATLLKAQDTVQTQIEKAQVKQAKHVMLFACDLVFDNPLKAVANVMCDVFGGGTYSLLFSVVREKMNLCYYCAARPKTRKGFISVDCGVDAKNLKKAHDGIIEQFERIKSGDFDDSIIKSSKTALVSSLKGAYDSSAALSGFYANGFDMSITPAEYADLINSVTKKDVVDLAKRFVLSHTYTLCGGEENE